MKLDICWRVDNAHLCSSWWKWQGLGGAGQRPIRRGYTFCWFSETLQSPRQWVCASESSKYCLSSWSRRIISEQFINKHTSFFLHSWRQTVKSLTANSSNGVAFIARSIVEDGTEGVEVGRVLGLKLIQHIDSSSRGSISRKSGSILPFRLDVIFGEFI